MSGPNPRNETEWRDGRPTGEGTAIRNDVADPHPSDEEHPYDAPHPGGTVTRHDINKVNDQVTDGTAPPRPDNVETNP